MANIIGEVQVVDGNLEIIDNNGNVIELEDGQKIKLDGDITATVRKSDGVISLVNDDGDVISVNDGDSIILQDNLNSISSDSTINETNVEADTRNKEEDANQNDTTDKNNSASTSDGNVKDLDNKETPTQEVQQNQNEIKVETTIPENNTPIDENDVLPINNKEKLPQGTTVEDLGQDNTLITLPTGEEIIVNNQNPLTVDNTVTTDNQDFQDNTLDSNVLDTLTNTLGNDGELVTNQNDDNNTPETEVQSDSSHTRVLDRNADTLDVKADLRETVSERLDSTNVPQEDVISFTSAEISLDGESIVKEGNEVSYTLNLSETPTSKVFVEFSFSGQAIENEDYAPVYTVEIPSGTKDFTFKIPTIDDYLKEGDESFTIKIVSVSGGGFDELEIDPTKDSVITTIYDAGSTPVTDPETPGSEDTVYVQLIQDDNAQEVDGSTLTHRIQLVDKDSNPVSLSTNSTIKVNLTYSNDTTENADFTTKVYTIDIPAGSSYVDITNIIKGDDIYELSESYTLSIGSVIDTNSSYEKLEIDSSNSVIGTINDEDKDGDTPSDDEDGDKPVVNIEATDNDAVEGTSNNSLVYTVSQNNVSEFDTTVDLSMTLNEVEVEDITSIVYTDSNGNVVTLDDATEINNFVTNGAELKIEAGDTSAPEITITIANDAIYEKSEALSMSISNAVNATIGTATDGATIYDEDSTTPSSPTPPDEPGTPSTPPTDESGDKPVVNIEATDNDAVEGTSNNSLVYTVSQNNVSEFDTTVDLSMTLNEVEVEDITSIVYTDSNGNVVTLDDATEINNFVTNGAELKIEAGDTSAPEITITIANDAIYEKSEALSMSISNAVNATIGTATDGATIYDEDSTTPSSPTPPDEPGTPSTPPTDESGDKPVVNIEATDNDAVEGTSNNSLVYTVSQNNVSEFDTTVDLSMTLNEVEVEDITSIVYTDSNGNVVTLDDATEINNFVTNGAELKIEAGDTSAPEITITIANDAIYEKSEALSMSISNAVNATIGTATDGATIYDEDSTTPSSPTPPDEPGTPSTPPTDESGDKPVVNIEATDNDAVEGTSNNSLVYTVSQNNVSEFDTTVDLSMTLNEVEVEDITSIVYTDSNGNVVTLDDATEINNFVTNGAELKIEAGDTSAPEITITIANDAIYEKSEALSMSISNAVNATIGTATDGATIYDEDSTTPSSPTPPDEPGTPSTPPTDESGDKPVVNIEATDNDAVEGTSNNSLVYTVSQNNVSEFDTTVDLSMTLNEVEVEDITSIVYTDSNGNVVTLDDATEINNFVTNGAELKIEAGDTSAPEITITIANDAIYEKSEALSMSISNAVNATIGTATDGATIYDEDSTTPSSPTPPDEPGTPSTPPTDESGDKPVVNIEATDNDAVEGTSNNSLVYTVSQNNVSEFDTTVDLSMTLNEVEVEDITSIVYTDSNGNVVTLDDATEINNFVTNGAELKIEAGDTSAPEITITIANDAIYEKSEALSMSISNAVNATIGTATDGATIYDEDSTTPSSPTPPDEPGTPSTPPTDESGDKPVVNIEATDNDAVEGTSNNSLVYTVSQNNVSEFDTTVDLSMTLNEVEVEDITSIVYTDSNGNVVTLDDATEINNFVTNGAELKIEAGDTSAPEITITIANDAIYEKSEALSMSISNAVNATIGTATDGATIYDEDSTTPSSPTPPDEPGTPSTPPTDESGDKPVVNIEATDNDAVEGTSNNSLVYTVSQNNVSEFDTTVDLSMTLNEVEVEDITSIVYTDSNGNVVTLDDATEINNFVTNGAELKIEAGDTSAPEITITIANDAIYEKSEALSMSISNAVNATIGTATDGATIYDEDSTTPSSPTPPDEPGTPSTPPTDESGDKPVVNIEATDNDAVEGTSNNSLVYTVSQNNVSEFDTTVDLSMTLNEVEVEDITSIVYTDSNGNVVTLDDATEINNFVTNGAELKIEAGDTSAPEITITIANDAIYEKSEALSMSISNAVNATIGTATDGATIYDEDSTTPSSPTPPDEPGTPSTPPTDESGDKPVVNIEATDNDAVEGTSNNSLVYTVSQNNVSEFDTTVDLSMTLNEVEVEDITSIVYTDSNGNVVTLDDATEINNFVTNGAELKIEAGDTSAPEITITIANDAIYEKSEALSMSISNAVNATIGTATDGATIYDEDSTTPSSPTPPDEPGTPSTPPTDESGDKPVVNIEATDNDAVEGTSNNSLVYTVSQNNVSEFDTTVDLSMTLNEVEVEDITSIVYTDSNGNVVTLDDATEINNFVTNGAELKIEAGDTSAPEITITIANDAIYEKSEALSMSISNAVNATIGTATDGATIYDEDSTTPSSPTPPDEPGTPSTPPTDESGDKPVVNIEATDNDAVEGTSNNSLVYTVSQNNVSEFDTTVDLSMTLNEVEVEDITSIVYTDSNGNVVTLDDATEINNFVTNGAELKIEAGDTSAPEITITIANDAIYEKSEALSMSISNAVNATIGTATDGATIYDEDSTTPSSPTPPDEPGTPSTPPTDESGDMPTLNVSDVTVTEGTDSYAQFTVSLSNESIQDVSFNLTLSDVTATGTGTDYGSNTATNIQVSTDGGTTWTNAASTTITAGNTSVLVRTPILNDLDVEADETFKLTATVTSGDVINTTNPFGTGTIIDNDTNVSIGTPDDSSVDEDDLSDGNDTSKESLIKTGSLDITSGSDSFDTTFNLTDINGNSISEGGDSGLTSGGNTVYYYLDDTSKQLTASTSNTEGGILGSNTVFTVSLNNTTSNSASYEFELKDAIDHVPGNGENIETIDFKFTTEQDNGYSESKTFSVNVVDDVPTVYDNNDSVFIGPKTTNLILILDASGSMGYDFAQNSGSSNERLNAMKSSAEAMINGYSDLGNVNVMVTYFSGSNIVTFTGSGSITNTQNSFDLATNNVWLDSSTAVSKIDTISANNNTYYSEAMDRTSEAFTRTYANGDTPDADFTYVYFMSDGDPTGGHEPTNSTKWDDFVNLKDSQGNYIVDGVDAVGITSNVATSHLNVVAGTDSADSLGLDRDGDVYTVTSAAEMETKLLGETTVTIAGNIFTDGNFTLIGEGADGSYVTSIEIGAKTYSYDGTTIKDELNATIGSNGVMTDIDTTLTDGVNGIGSKFVSFNFETGEYSYRINSTLAGNEYSESFNTIVKDGDGDIQTKDITLKINTIVDGTTGDDTMMFDDVILDFKAGTDSLVLDSGIDLNFDTSASQIDNVEKIDLNSNGDHTLNNLGIQDLIDITDSNNELQILGNSGDTVNLKNADGGNWTDSGINETIDGQDYDIYTKSGDSTAVTLKIDQDINTNII
ncbi:MAG: beta strand repeat-containing protein [Halarcobacter sp.]